MNELLLREALFPRCLQKHATSAATILRRDLPLETRNILVPYSRMFRSLYSGQWLLKRVKM